MLWSALTDNLSAFAPCGCVTIQRVLCVGKWRTPCRGCQDILRRLTVAPGSPVLSKYPDEVRRAGDSVASQRVARKAYALGRKVLNEPETLVIPDLIAMAPGTGGIKMELQPTAWARARIMKTIVNLILRMAFEKRSWGYTRIRGALANLGYQAGRGTIDNILREPLIVCFELI
jgi:hypothetical protein